VERDDLNLFFKKLGIDSKDSIQAVNKIEQWGLKRGESSRRYWVPFPYQLGVKHLLRTPIKDYSNTDKMIEAIKLNIKNDYLDVPNKKWQLGHKNPEEPNTNNKENIVLQPPIQQKYRDKYIFIDSLTKMPTPKYLIEKNFSPFNEKQQRELYEALKKKFEPVNKLDAEQTKLKPNKYEFEIPTKKKLSKKDRNREIEV